MTHTIEELEAALDYNNTKIGDLSSAFWPSHEYELRVNHYRTMNKALTQAIAIARGESVVVPFSVLSVLRECKSDYCHPCFTDRRGTGDRIKEAIKAITNAAQEGAGDD